MGTKNNPGRYDRYAAAAPDEPMFTLLGRDRFAEQLVRLWAEGRAAQGEAPEVVAEAFQCAEAMRGYCVGLGRTPQTINIAPEMHRLLAALVALTNSEGQFVFFGPHTNEEERELQAAFDALPRLS